MNTLEPPIDLGVIREAAARLRGVAHRTPTVTSRQLDAAVGARVFLKAEGLQRVGAFKFRGAYNAVAQLSPAERAGGVVASSSGNHAQALALAASLCGARATILMPADAPASKRAATEAYGAEIVTFDRYADDRDAMTVALAAERGAALVHAYDDVRVMAGAGTAGLELIEDADDLDVVVVPLGGGGLLSGCVTAVKGLSPGTRVVGVEPAASPDYVASLAAGERVTVEIARSIADGQLLPTPGALPWRGHLRARRRRGHRHRRRDRRGDAAAVRARQARRRAERGERAGRGARRPGIGPRPPRAHRRGPVRARTSPPRASRSCSRERRRPLRPRRRAHRLAYREPFGGSERA